MANILERALADLAPPKPELPAVRNEAPPRDLMPVRRALKPAPMDQTPRTYRTRDEAQAMIQDAITTYLADPMPESMLLIAAPAGIGKTTIGVRAAESAAAGGQKVMYIGPRKEFFADLMALASRPAWWYAWQSRHGGDADGYAATCRWPAQIATWQQRGYDSRSFCSNPRICGWSYIHTSCRYYAQERRAKDIIFAQYEHIALGHLLLDKMHVIVGDELPTRAFLHPWHIPAAAIVPPNVDAPGAQALLTRLATLASVPNVVWRGPELLESLGGAAHVARVAEAYRLDVAVAAYAPELRGPDDAEDAPYFHLPWTLALLGREAARAREGKPAISRVRVDSSGLTLLLRRAPKALPPHVIWLDATAKRGLYETLFGRPVQVVQPDVRLRGRIFQVIDSLNNKQSLRDDGPKTEHIRRQVDRILARGYQKPAWVGYKDLIHRVIPPAYADTDQVTHFGGSRGTNKLQECDCLIVVGAPQPPTPQLLDAAAMLYHERDEPFDTTWTTRDRPFEGQPWAWPIGGFWDDPDLQVLIEQSRESELVQALHRARPLFRDVDIWLLTNVPLDGVPVELLSLRDLFDAPAGVDPYRWPEVVALAEQRIDAAGIVTSADLVDAGLCTPPAARKYLEALATRQGWSIVTAPASGRGKPPIGCVKGYQAPNIENTPISKF